MKEPANPFLRDFQRKRSRMNGLAGSLPFIRSNLCPRHILNKITPRGHEDWPDSAVKLVDDLAGESPASASFPVGTVVIPGDGAGDQPVESPEVNVLDGWMRIWSAMTGGQAKQQVVAKANRS